MNYLCSNCDIALSQDDLDSCEIVSVGKLYCEDCLINVCRDLFIDHKGLLTHTWDRYEKFVIDRLVKSVKE